MPIAPHVSIAPATAQQAEGQDGSTVFVFEVTRSGDLSAAASVEWTVSGSGTHPAAGSDLSGGTLPHDVLGFSPGEATKTIRIAVAGDSTAEWDEGFVVNLHHPSTGLLLDQVSAVATIINDDPGKPRVPLTLVSTDANGTPANTFSVEPIFSRDGGRIAFWSSASNLVAGDTNQTYDIFVKDLVSGAVILVSADATGRAGHGASTRAAFSPDGTLVAFASSAADLVAGDTNGTSDIFIKDLASGAITRVSTDSAGSQADAGSTLGGPVAFSPDGRQLVFSSFATNLVAGDTNATGDVFIKDLVSGAVTRVSTGVAGSQADDTSSEPSFSPDGKRLVFSSWAKNLVAGDTNAWQDVFLKDLVTGSIIRLSADAAGTQGNSYANDPVFSPDGALVAFHSGASNLVSGDTNKTADIFLKDPLSGAIARVSTTATGAQANSDTASARFSPDGTRMVFVSQASNLVAGDAAGSYDVFVKDLSDGSVSWVSTSSGVTPMKSGASSVPTFSPDGAAIAFASSAPLVPGDANGSYDIFLRDLLAEAPVTVAITPAQTTVAEGRTTATVSFTVERNGLTATDQAVSWMVIGTGPHPADGLDFSGQLLPTGIVTFGAGVTKQTVKVTIAGDRVIEDDEQFNVVLFAASDGLGLAGAPASVVIRNDDATAGLAQATASVTEGAASAALALTRTGDLGSTVRIAWSIKGSGAAPASAADFIGGVLPTGVVTFAPGEASQTLFLPVLNDKVSEGAETCTVTLASPTVAPTTGAVLPGLLVATVTILDDDPAPPGPPSTPDLAQADDTGLSGTDNITSLARPLFTGQALAGGDVSLLDGTALIGTAKADASGLWQMRPLSDLVAGEHRLTATVTAGPGGSSPASGELVVTVDTTPPSRPRSPDLMTTSDDGPSSTDNITSLRVLGFSGTVDAATLVTLFDGATPIGTALADGTGIWTIPSAALAPGTHAVAAQATDVAGNRSLLSPALTVTVIDTPATATRPDLIAASDTGISVVDNVTSVTTPRFVGRAEAGALVTLLDGATEIGRGIVGVLGNWAITAAPLAEGVHAITAYATGASGIPGALSEALLVTVDRSAPATPATPDLFGTSVSGWSPADNITSARTLTVVGRAEANGKVTLYDGATVVGTGTVGALGNWSVRTSELGAGLHGMTARVSDRAGNISDASATLSVTMDLDPPPPPPAAPDLVRASDSGTRADDNLTNDLTPTFQGRAEAGSRVTLYDGAFAVGAGIAGPLGNWAVTSVSLAQGTHSLTARVTDIAGNTGTASAAILVTIDTTAPAPATVPDLATASDTGPDATDDATTDNTPTFVGQAEAGSRVTIFVDDTPAGSGTAGALGSWSVTTSALAVGDHLVTAQVTDAAGNTGFWSAPLVVVIEAPPPSAARVLIATGDTIAADAGYRMEPASAIAFLAGGDGEEAFGGGTSMSIPARMPMDAVIPPPATPAAAFSDATGPHGAAWPSDMNEHTAGWVSPYAARTSGPDGFLP